MSEQAPNPLTPKDYRIADRVLWENKERIIRHAKLEDDQWAALYGLVILTGVNLENSKKLTWRDRSVDIIKSILGIPHPRRF